MKVINFFLFCIICLILTTGQCQKRSDSINPQTIVTKAESPHKYSAFSKIVSGPILLIKRVTKGIQGILQKIKKKIFYFPFPATPSRNEEKKTLSEPIANVKMDEKGRVIKETTGSLQKEGQESDKDELKGYIPWLPIHIKKEEKASIKVEKKEVMIFEIITIYTLILTLALTLTLSRRLSQRL
jgi:hypothetical protein